MNTFHYRILGLALGATLVSCSNPFADTRPRREKPDTENRYNNTPTEGPGPSNANPNANATTNTTPNNPYFEHAKKQTEAGVQTGLVSDGSPPKEEATHENKPPVPPAPKEKEKDAQASSPPPSQPASLPFGKPVPGKKGFVYSPYTDQSAGMIDVRDYSPGTKVRDPYTSKIFLVP